MKDFFIQGHLTDEDHDRSELLPLFSQEEEDEMNKADLPEVLPILPLRNTVLFPGVVIPITVGRDKSIRLIKDAYKGDKIIGVVAQKDGQVEDPTETDCFNVGTQALILKMLRMPDGNTTIIIQGKKKFVLGETVQQEPYLKARVSDYKEKASEETPDREALISSIRDMSLRIVDLSPHIPSEAAMAVKNIDSDSFLINFISSNLNIEAREKQKILEGSSLKERAELVLHHLTNELQLLELKNEIQSKVRIDLDKQQRDYFLQQQIRAIQEELGQDGPDKEIQNLREKGSEKKWPATIEEAFSKELDKLQRMNSMSPDYSVSLNYAQLLLDLPWSDFTKDSFDLKKARKILDHDHFGLEKVKDRILEHLAVLKLRGDMKSPILCLYGPPGVGKTSLGKSIAKAMGRKYVRMSLGGLHDESEIRGHRKTYIGAMPGRIIQSLKKANSSNPVFVLDEIDKIGNDFRGDPSSALLEVLDPEQNGTFYDNYVELDYDLSKVLFIATANSLDSIQPALLDRMEIIEINGYTTEEKVQIAKNHLVPKQIAEHGLKKGQLSIADKAIEKVILEYTRESGVRTLDKRLASLARHAAREVVTSDATKVSINAAQVNKILGVQRLDQEIYEGNDQAGVVTGLAWTPTGGVILSVESILTKGKGKLTLTGQLGEVMKESAITAQTYLKAHSDKWNIDIKAFDNWDIHIHFPAGAIPKDGPSAGITILTSLASLFTQRKIKQNLAMTGEITLRGKVLPVGGIKEKILAAKRAGIKEIILCEQNRKDVEDIKPDYVKDLKFHYVGQMSEVLDIALLPAKVKKPVSIDYYLHEKPVVSAIN